MFGLVGDLCRSFLGNVDSCKSSVDSNCGGVIVGETGSGNDGRRRRRQRPNSLQIRAFAQLLMSEKRKNSNFCEDGSWDDERENLRLEDHFSMIAHDYRSNLKTRSSRKRFDKGQKLEDLASRLLSNSPSQNLESVLRLLIHLRDSETDPEDSPECVPYCKRLLDSEFLHIPSEGSLYYGESYLHRREYTKYTRQLFHQLPSSSPHLETRGGSLKTNYFTPENNQLKGLPGTGLSFFTPPSTLNRDDTSDLYGSKLKATSNPSLIIPPLNLMLNEEGARHLRVPAVTSQNKENDDGYHSPVDGPNIDVTPENDDSIWNQDIWKVQVPKRRIWEDLGNLDPPKEKAFLTESSEAVHHTWAISKENMSLISNHNMMKNLRIIPEMELIEDIGYLMIGVASRTFEYRPNGEGFHIISGTCIHGVTPEMLTSFSESFIKCGNQVRYLEDFTTQTGMNGLIFKGFLVGVSNYLKVYRSQVMKIISKSRTCLQLNNFLHKLIKQIQFLAQLCKNNEGDKSQHNLPSGIQLLAHLFDKTLHINSSDLYFVLVSIIRSSAEPYFRFLERWMFQGVCLDEYSEFGMIVDHSVLSVRDRTYWTDSYTVAELPKDSSICGGGDFINDVQQQVHSVGKSLNLLKLIAPNHHLSLSSLESQPPIKLLVTPMEELQLKKEVLAYSNLMNAISDEKTISLSKQKKILALKKSKILQEAREKHIKNIERIQSEHRELREANDLKKRKFFQDLKEQARLDKIRKNEERARIAEEDKIWAEKALRKEQEEIERERKEKEAMEEYYRSLEEAAELRQKRAEWKFRRNEFRSKRIKFWRNENLKVQNMLNDLKTTEEISNRVPLKNNPEREKSRLPNEWKSIKISEDELKNIILILEDQESNIITENIQLNDYSDDIQSKILNDSFSSLPEWIQTKILSNYKTNSDDTISSKTLDNSVQSSVKPRTCFDNKRKRPDSFFDEIADKKMVIDEEMGVSNANLVYPISSDISTIDGRKRPTSKPIEQILYPNRYKSNISSKLEGDEIILQMEDLEIKSTTSVVPYDKDIYNSIYKAKKMEDFIEKIIPRQNKPELLRESVDSNAFTPLTLLMENSILIPLRAQATLVNKSILNHILLNLNLMRHFEALRNYLLFHDGEFGHYLSYTLFQEIADCKSPNEVLNPASLNRLVDNAMMASNFAQKDEMAENVGFNNRSPPQQPGSTSLDILSLLELTYKTEWPCNIIITTEALDKYGQIFRFLMQLKKAVWGLEQVFHNLKDLRHEAKGSKHFHLIHLMRHEMLNFVSVAQGYVSTQVLDVSWAEFLMELEDKVLSLDGLYEAHNKYLNKALFRCLLNKKAKPVQKIISDIFNVIVKFSLTMTNLTWTKSHHGEDGELIHPSFHQLEESYNLFKEYSSFLYQVVSKLAARGYQHHLHDLMLRLNYNGFYQRLT